MTSVVGIVNIVWPMVVAIYRTSLKNSIRKRGDNMLNDGEKSRLESSLAQCTGTSQYYRHWTKRMKYTDGVHLLQEGGKCGWLIDAIASYQGDRRVVGVPFQLWQIEVKEDRSGVLTMREDSDTPIIIEQVFSYTDFPFDEFKLYLIDGILLLPSEY